MKKGLLLVSIILASQSAFSQLTQANEPGIGESSPMYTITDTAGVTMSGIIGVAGTGVTWDYSTVTMEASASGAVGVEDATTTPNAAEFPTSTKAISQGTIIQYFNSTAASRVSQGFVFTDPNFGEVVVKFDASNEAIQLTYPFNLSSTNSDSYAGNAALPSPLPAATVTGNIYSTIDGTGTLSLPGGTSIANVFRLKTMDTTNVDAGLMTVEVIRTQLEYYDLSDQNLPIFVDAYISISGMGAQRQVLSKSYATVGLDKNTIQNVVLFPNPSTGEFTISGEFTKGNVEVLDVAGKVVYASEVAAGSTVKLNAISSGMYTVKLSANGKTSIQKITIK